MTLIQQVEESTHELCDHFIKEFFKRFFIERDIATILPTVSKNLTGFGPLKYTVAFSFDQSLKNLKQELDTIPAPIDYQIRQSRVKALSSDIFLYIAVLDISIDLDTKTVPLKDLRVSFVISTSKEGEFLFEHMHLSYPTASAVFAETGLESSDKSLSQIMEDVVHHRIKDVNEAYKELEQVISTDDLTGLRSRIKIEEDVNTELRRASRYGSIFSIVMMDLDRFKLLNDWYGHLFGDFVLKEFGSMLNGALRETDFAGRWGGDEFLLMFPQATFAKAQIVMKKLLDRYQKVTVESLLVRYQKEYPGLFSVDDFSAISKDSELFPFKKMSFSYGIAEYRIKDTLLHLINRADIGLYEMKRDLRSS